MNHRTRTSLALRLQALVKGFLMGLKQIIEPLVFNIQLSTLARFPRYTQTQTNHVDWSAAHPQK
jgi:hypothetical protein